MNVLANTAMSISEEQMMLLDVARNFVRERAQIADIRAQLESDNGYDPALWREIVDLGWLGMALPESVAGSGLGMGALVPVLESMGRGLLATPLMTSTLAAQLLLRAGGTAHEKWLQRIGQGEVATVALLDGADWGASNNRVQIDSSGRLTGCKRHIEEGQNAAIYVVVGQCEGDDALAIVERSALDGSAIRPNTTLDLTRRSAAIDFSGVSASAIVTGEKVSAAVRDIYLLGALCVAAETTGAIACTLDTIVDYLKTRKQFGKLIGSYQALKHPTVDIYCGLEDARSFIYHAAAQVSDEPLDTDAEIACRMAKAHAGDIMAFAGDRAVQFHGGIGFTWDCDSTLFIRRAQWARHAYGDAIHHRKRLASLLLDQGDCP